MSTREKALTLIKKEIINSVENNNYKMILAQYETFSNPFISYVSWPWLQRIVAKYVARKVSRKYNQWILRKEIAILLTEINNNPN